MPLLMPPDKSHQPQPGKPETTTPNEDRPAEDKHSFNWGWVAWPFVILFLYLLSTGPVALWEVSRHIEHNQIVWMYLAPWRWAYQETPFHKPLGMYLHLWVPNRFDSKGDIQNRIK